MNSKEIVDSYTDNDIISLVKSNDLEEACDVRLKANTFGVIWRFRVKLIFRLQAMRH